jgi:hypothetical protein
MKKYGIQPNQMTVTNTQTFLITHELINMTGQSVYNNLVAAGFAAPTQYKHKGTAAMDASGNIFDHYTE